MKPQKNKLIKIIFIIITIYIFIAYYINYKNKALYINARFTIANPVENTFGSGNSGVKYEYIVNGHLYSAWDSTDKKTTEGQKYFVIYNEKNPQHSSFFVECPVPDSIKIIPNNGWKKIPVPEYQKKVDKYFRGFNYPEN